MTTWGTPAEAPPDDADLGGPQERGACPRQREDPDPCSPVRFRAGGRDPRRRGRGAWRRRGDPRLHRSVHPGGRTCADGSRSPRSATRTSTRSRAGSNRCAATWPACATRQEYLDTIAAYSERPAARRLGARRRLVDAGLSRRHADRGRPGRGHRRAARLPAQPRPPQRLGEQPQRWPAAEVTARTPDPADGRIERDRDGRPLRRAARRRDAARRRLRAGAGPGRADRRAARRPAPPALARHHQHPGRLRRRRGRDRHARRVRHLPARRRRPAADLPGDRGAVVGPAPRPAPARHARRPAGRRPTAAATSAPPRSS